MSIGFGFSLGDFVAALELVGTIVDALGDSGSASAEYRELLRVLYSRETALLQVKRIELDDSQRAEMIALQQAAAQCQRTIDDFWNKIRKYQPHLGSSSECSNFRLKTAWTKIKWAVCRRDDLAKFKADIVGHRESIQMLLAVVQMYTSTFLSKYYELKNQEGSKSIKIRESRRKVNGPCWEALKTPTSHLCTNYLTLPTARHGEFCAPYSRVKWSSCQADPASTVGQDKQLLEIMAQIV